MRWTSSEERTLREKTGWHPVLKGREDTEVPVVLLSTAIPMLLLVCLFIYWRYSVCEWRFPFYLIFARTPKKPTLSFKPFFASYLSLTLSVSLPLLFSFTTPRFDVLVMLLWVPSVPFLLDVPRVPSPPPAISTCVRPDPRTVLSGVWHLNQNNFCPYLSHCHSMEWCWVLWRTANTIIRVKSEYPKKAAFTQQRMALLDCPKRWVQWDSECNVLYYYKTLITLRKTDNQPNAEEVILNKKA